MERKLDGAEDRIKAYCIATGALGRPASFDPQNDPIVRVQAWSACAKRSKPIIAGN